MKDRVMLVGDYYHGLADLKEHLTPIFTTKSICFIDGQQYKEVQLPSNWEFIDCRDFHELTIAIMDFEPDIVIYLSPFLRISRAELYPELADMTNAEAVEHLRETLSIHNSLLILIWKETDQLPVSVLKDTLLTGEDMVSGMGRLTILLTSEIIDNSPEGYLSYISSMDQDINRDITTTQQIATKIIEVIEDNITGRVKVNDVTPDDLENMGDAPLFQGNPDNFI